MSSRSWLGLVVLLLPSLLMTVNAARAENAPFTPSPELVAAAKKEGRLVLYTTNFLETEQAIAKRFNARFPGIAIEIIRAPGGALTTRMRAENATGRLSADVADLSDRTEAAEMMDLFAPYAPPNAKDYLPEFRTGDRLWPRIRNSWVIGYNTALVPNPPATWHDLVRSDYAELGIGLTVALAGGGPWTLAMFQRQVLGEKYWGELAATKPRLFPSGASMLDALTRGDVAIAPITTQMVVPLSTQDAPVKWIAASEGMPTTTFAAGILLKAAHHNAAKLFLDWSLSREGQTALLEFGSFSALRDAANPPGMDMSKMNVWQPNDDEFLRLRSSWIDDWSRVFNYRQ
jgi:iron(III) transport system substrate-binding protein